MHIDKTWLKLSHLIILSNDLTFFGDFNEFAVTREENVKSRSLGHGSIIFEHLFEQNHPKVKYNDTVEQRKYFGCPCLHLYSIFRWFILLYREKLISQVLLHFLCLPLYKLFNLLSSRPKRMVSSHQLCRTMKITKRWSGFPVPMLRLSLIPSAARQ